MTIPALLLMDDKTPYIWHNGQWQQSALEDVSQPCVVLFDQCGESFITQPMPSLSIFERTSFARNRLLSLCQTHTLFYARTTKETLYGASAPLDSHILKALRAPMLRVGLLGWDVAKAFIKPTILILTLPSHTQRLFLFEEGAPLFARTLNPSAPGSTDALEATLYHIERHFQKSRSTMAFLTWNAQDLAHHLLKHPLGAPPFDSPWSKNVHKARLHHAIQRVAPLCLAGALTLVTFQGIHLVHLHRESASLQNSLTRLQTQSMRLKDHPNTPLLTALPAFERLQKHPDPLTDMATLARLNTSHFQPQAVSWDIKDMEPHMRFEVCSIHPMSHADLEEAVREAMGTSKRPYDLSTKGVVSLNDPLDRPVCLSGESSREKRP